MAVVPRLWNVSEAQGCIDSRGGGAKMVSKMVSKQKINRERDSRPRSRVYCCFVAGGVGFVELAGVHLLLSAWH